MGQKQTVKGLKRLKADRVLITPDVIVEKKIHGIIIPGTAQEQPHSGIIKAVGPGVTQNGVLIPVNHKEGERVLYGKYSGTEVEIEGETYMMMRETDIWAEIDHEPVKATKGGANGKK